MKWNMKKKKKVVISSITSTTLLALKPWDWKQAQLHEYLFLCKVVAINFGTPCNML